MPVVNMPDGTPVNFPDAMPPDQIKGLIASKFPDEVAGISAPMGPPQPDNSLFGRISQDYASREAQATDIANQYANGKITGLEAYPETALKIAGIGPQALGEVGSSMMGMLPDTLTQPIKQAAGAVANAAGNLPSFGGGTIGQRIPQELAANPRLAQGLSAAGDALNLASVLPIKAAAEALPGMIPKNTSMQGAADIAAKDAAVTASREAQTAALRKSASQDYKSARADGLSLNDEETAKLNASMSSLIPETDLEKRSWASSSAAKHAQDITDSIATETPSLNGLLAKRNDINSDIKAAARAGQDAEEYKLGLVKDKLDETMMTEKTGTLQKANLKWGQQAVLGDMDVMVNKALSRVGQPASSLDTALNNYLLSYKGDWLSDKEFQALKDVTSNSALDKLKRSGASGVTKYAATLVGAHAGPVGAAAGYFIGHYGSEALKDAVMTAKLEKLDKFRELIMQRKLPDSYPVSEDTFGASQNIAQKLKANRK